MDCSAQERLVLKDWFRTERLTINFQRLEELIFWVSCYILFACRGGWLGDLREFETRGSGFYANRDIFLMLVVLAEHWSVAEFENKSYSDCFKNIQGKLGSE